LRPRRFSGYLLSLAAGIVIGYSALDGAAYAEQLAANLRLEADPKGAPQVDRSLLSAILDDGYDSAEAAVSGKPSVAPGYYERVRRELSHSAGRSPWLRMRLIEELGKSGQLENCGFLVKYSQSETKGRLKTLALDTARSMPIQEQESTIVTTRASGTGT
jgi:hypothetical protein